MSRYLIAYDVSHGSQRTRLARVLKEFGVRLQWSVFEVDIEPSDLPDLRRRAGGLLGPQDRFDIVPIDPDPRRPRLSWRRRPPGSDGVSFS